MTIFMFAAEASRRAWPPREAKGLPERSMCLMEGCVARTRARSTMCCVSSWHAASPNTSSRGIVCNTPNKGSIPNVPIYVLDKFSSRSPLSKAASTIAFRRTPICSHSWQYICLGSAPAGTRGGVQCFATSLMSTACSTTSTRHLLVVHVISNAFFFFFLRNYLTV